MEFAGDGEGEGVYTVGTWSDSSILSEMERLLSLFSSISAEISPAGVRSLVLTVNSLCRPSALLRELRDGMQ